MKQKIVLIDHTRDNGGSGEVGAGHESFAGSEGGIAAPAPSLLPTVSPAKVAEEKHQHTLAILVVPRSAAARIANEAVLETAIAATADRLSVSIRTNVCDQFGGNKATLAELRRYTSEVYEMAWDAVVGSVADGDKLLDLVVYPQGMPNIAQERAIELCPDLSCICGRDSDIVGGLDEHANAANAWSAFRGMETLEVLRVGGQAEIAGDPNVVYLEDDENVYEDKSRKRKMIEEKKEDPEGDQTTLYSSVCVGGTFDGMHYGHRKLLTLAISSVDPIDGTLFIGVKRDEMLIGKEFATSIPPLEDRIEGVLEFIGKLAPGIKSRVRCAPMDDESLRDWMLGGNFDALMVSSDTLSLGWRLNKYRQEVLGLKPVTLLCTQRSMPHGMSSTALRRMKNRK